MKDFALLLERLAFTPARNAKLQILQHYLERTPDPDRGWALAALTGNLDLKAVKASAIGEMIRTRTDPVLFEMSRDYVGDLAETIAHVLPPADQPAAPLGLAEVNLELQTAGGRVNVARRVYRDGTGEQDLNGRGVRARDVQAALRGTGLGPGGLAVIGQGEVSGVVQAEGRTLLGYLQEAAGLSRSVTVRQETEQRLKEADAHLRELQLLLDERRHAAERLARAAAQAREHRDLSLRALTLEDALKRERQASLAREIAQARADAQAAQTRSTELGREVQAAAQRVEEAREQAQEARSRRDAYAGALETLRAAREAHEQAARYRQHLQTEADTLNHELAHLPQAAPAQEAPDLLALQERVGVLRSDAEAAEHRARQLDAELGRARTRAAQAAEAAARADASLDTLRAELERAEGNLEGTQHALAEAHGHLLQASERRAAAEMKLGNPD